MPQQSRRFCFTSYNDEPPVWDTTTMGYLCYQRESCPSTGRRHWQGYCEMLKKTTIGRMQKISKCSWLVCRGTGEQNRTYCSKSDSSEEGSWMEHGTMFKQGQRTDLEGVAEAIRGGASVDSIAEQQPHLFHQYGRTLERLETVRRKKAKRTHQTFITWIHGSTGTGKSRSLADRIANEGRDIANAYWHPVSDRDWWDSYEQQEDVILDDFRGEIKFQVLLKLADWHTTHVSRRGLAPIPFISKHIWITSCSSPERVYAGVCDDTERLDQLRRRIREVIHMENPYSEPGDSTSNVIERISADAE